MEEPTAAAVRSGSATTNGTSTPGQCSTAEGRIPATGRSMEHLEPSSAVRLGSATANGFSTPGQCSTAEGRIPAAGRSMVHLEPSAY